MLKDFKNILKLMGKYKYYFFPLVLVACIIQAPRDTIRTHVFKELIDYFVYGETTLKNALLFAGLYIILVMLGPLIMYILKNITERVMCSIRMFAFDKVKNMTAEFYEKHHSGDVMSRLNHDVDDLEWAMGIHEVLGFHLTEALVIIPYYIYLDWRLAIVVVVTNLIAAIVNLKFAMPIRWQAWEMSDKISGLSQVLIENITGLKIIKMFGLSDHFRKRMTDGMDKLYGAEKKFIKTETKMQGLNHLIHSLSFGIIVVFATILVFRGEIQVGAFASTVMLSSTLSFNFLRIGQNLSWINKTYASVDRLFQLLDEKMDPERYATGSDDHESGVSIKNGYFEYIEGDNVINNLNITVPHGSMAALVGNSGGGKSTAIKLILGLYPLKNGQMTINKRPVCDYTLTELRKQISYVPQDAYIFNGTIRQNILYGNAKATDEQFEYACSQAHVSEFVKRQPSGYETVVGERGIKLSGGQRQRIAIARAILKDAPVLLLDEATSSLDSESEFFIQESLETLMKGKTSVVVAHRLSTIEMADIIYFIKDGTVAEQGTHSELLAMNGLYAELYYRDFADRSAGN